MARDFGVTTDDIEWVATAYTLALGVIVPLSAWVGDRVGLTRAYMACLILFCIASALCGLAWNLESEIVFRIIQAIPGGVLPVVTLPLVYRIVPRESIGSAMGIYGVGILFAPGIGPTLGGYLVEYVDWRLVFFINVPVGIVAALAAYFLLPPTAPSSTRRFDWLGFITIAYGLFALLLAFTEGQSWGWTSYRILILIVSGTLSLALFVIIELEMDEPLVDLRVFRYWPYVNSLLLVSTLSVGLFVVLFYLPLFMQNAQGIAPLKTGVLLLPEALVMMFFMPIAGRLYDLLGPRIPAVVGLVIATYGTWLLCGINPDMSEGEVMLWTSIRAAGNALALMPIMTAGLAAIPPQFASSGSAFQQHRPAGVVLAGAGRAGRVREQPAEPAAGRPHRSVARPLLEPTAAGGRRAGDRGHLPALPATAARRVGPVVQQRLPDLHRDHCGGDRPGRDAAQARRGERAVPGAGTGRYGPGTAPTHAAHQINRHPARVGRRRTDHRAGPGRAAAACGAGQATGRPGTGAPGQGAGDRAARARTSDRRPAQQQLTHPRTGAPLALAR
jgi:EmrB/QacA subfamily drug resistance transporter